MASDELIASTSKSTASQSPQYGCLCLNVQLATQGLPVGEASISSQGGVAGMAQLFAVDSESFQVSYPSLVLRESISIKGQTCPALKCKHCDTIIYAVRKVASSGPSRLLGFQVASSSILQESSSSKADPHQAPAISPSAAPFRKSSVGSANSSSREREDQEREAAALSAAIIKPADGHVWILPGCLDGQGILQATESSLYSPIYGICLAPQSEEALARTEQDGEEEPEEELPLGRGRSRARRSSSSKISPATVKIFTTPSSGLPPVPSSLLHSPPASPSLSTAPGVPSSLSARYKSPTRASAASPTAQIFRYQNDFSSQLESRALKRLKQARAEADREIQALIAKHADVLQRMQAQAQLQGKVLMAEAEGRADAGTSAPSSFKQAHWTLEKSHGLGRRRSNESITTVTGNPATPSHSVLQDHSMVSSRGNFAPTPHEIGGTAMGRTRSDDPAGHTSIQPSAPVFPRRNPPMAAGARAINGVSANAASSSHTSIQTVSSLSALSASFAMRGRDPPMQPTITAEDWAAKKRLRERYPEGDHSAMNSEVNSVVNSEDSSEVEDEGGEDERGRGRDRGRDERGRGRSARPLELHHVASEQQHKAKESGPTFAPGSAHLGSKTTPSQAQLSIADVETEKQAGQAGEIVLKPRDPPPSGTEPLKPATRRARDNAEKGGAKDQQHRKSVAFAETTENVQAPTVDEDEQQEEGEIVNELLVDESDNAVFEIDEEVEREEAAAEEGKLGEDLVDEAVEDYPSSSDAEPSLAASMEGKPASISASLAMGGSLLALAAGETHQLTLEQQWSEPNFDPSSLRIEDFHTRHSASESSKRVALHNLQIAANDGPRRETERGNITSKGHISIGDAEARLSGLLAPHAPSHRDFWKKGKSRKVAKFELNDEEEEKWAAWKDRVQAKEVEAARRAQEEGDEDVSYSVPSGDEASPGSCAIQMMSGIGFSSIIRDGSSGFDREPKTSLPCNERMMVPSLRKAMRRAHIDKPSAAGAPSLPSIEDESPRSLRAGQVEASIAQRMADKQAQAEHSRSMVKNATDQVLPGSVSQKGFAFGQLTAQGACLASGVDPEVKSSVPSLKAPVAILAGIQAGAGSASSSPRRSPRPEYVPPPPPTSSSTVLQPDPAHMPKALKLFDVEPDKSFAVSEKGEEESEDIEKTLKFMHRLQMLKLNKRTGWLHHRVKRPESIADHMYRMALLAMLCPADDIDIGKCVMLALVHDLAEAEVGDLTPLDDVPKEEKLRREREAIDYYVHDLLESSPAALRIEKLWQEYEDRITKESKLVKDLDRFELCLQALEYEREYDIRDLQPFFGNSINLISHPRQRRWAKQLAIERQEMWAARGVNYKQEFVNGDVH
ncbi:hypothetical protein K437DRAFT_255919 [Tilletiaria anomala UBC 951]|uniref:5'-deoxynucleotidase n=1 Tax=Tilletiaria anomala (strain ATCC 24038 / CBS 436.72 / UBC 951) TaxID=1037660 RepID=A0A066W3K3_TILAU|nr:uncharacterized protein K437DRAFT_255919 [Tilletiaria anomala UBC 951]KDN47133.1 hypothetical protein K437DRAFT_255919 [Tilletiaria anomala UBC 951]